MVTYLPKQHRQFNNAMQMHSLPVIQDHNQCKQVHSLPITLMGIDVLAMSLLLPVSVTVQVRFPVSAYVRTSPTVFPMVDNVLLCGAIPGRQLIVPQVEVHLYDNSSSSEPDASMLQVKLTTEPTMKGGPATEVVMLIEIFCESALPVQHSR